MILYIREGKYAGEFKDLLKIEIERDNDIIEPKKETYLLHLYDWRGYIETKTYKGERQSLEIYEDTAKEQRAILSAIKRERQDIKGLIDEMIFNYEASASGTDNAQLKEIYIMKAQGLRDLLDELKTAELIEAEEEAGGDDISTATYKEIKAQNNED